MRLDRLGTARLEGSKSKLEAVGALVDQPSVRLFTTAAYSPHFGRTLRVVVLQSQTTGDYLVLASSDPRQPADEVVACYRLRYQIELLIRDAKQHGGLAHCQARSQAKLDFHLNMSMAALNLGRLMSRRAGLSMRSYAREAYNRFLAGRLLSELGLEAELVETHPGVRRVVQTGRVTW